MYPLEPTKETKLRLALIDVLASLKGWMEIQDKADSRRYDKLAVEHGERILKETK